MTNKNILCLLLLSTSLAACGGGGAKPVISAPPVAGPLPTPTPTPTPTPAPSPAPVVEADNRIPIETVTKQYTLENHGATAVEYRTAPHRSSSEFPRTDKYKIADHGFFQVAVTGTHTGVTVEEDPLEPADPGPWEQGSYIVEANINGDEHSDFFMFEFMQGSRDDRPNAYIHAWINDGEGHFTLSSSTVFADGEACIENGSMNNKTDPDNPCGYHTGVVRHPLVADFNGDGIDDIYHTSILHLSSNGVLQNRSRINLPDFFFNDTYVGPVFTHDNYAGDADGDGDLDIFVPIEQSSRAGFKANGEPFVNCDSCNQKFPWAMLINDGAGNFTLNQNFPVFGVGNQSLLGNIPSMYVPTNGQPRAPLALTAAIADFDNDGFGDVAVGWQDPGVTEYWGLGKNSAGAVYYNDGNNDWRNRDIVTLPANYYGANGRANDMEVMDIDGDGLMDIVLAVTKSNPYYEGRMVQFFRNTNGVNFEDVTSTANPFTKYADGSGTSWWNGEGKLTVLDFDKDGCQDVVDSTYNTYVLLGNCRGQFSLYEDYPVIDERGHRSPLYPVEIDGKWQYDFIGYTHSKSGDVGTTTYFQVLDPPSLIEQIRDDLFTRPNQYSQIADIATRAYSDVFYHSRQTSNQAVQIANRSDRLIQQGLVTQGGNFGFAAMNTQGRESGQSGSIDYRSTAVAGTLQQDAFRFTVAYSRSEFDAVANSQFFGQGRASTAANTVGTELTYAQRFDNLNFRFGGRYNHTQVDGFTETMQGGSPFIVDAQTYRSVAAVFTADYRQMWQVSPTLALYGGGDVEVLNYLYQNNAAVRFNTGLGSSLVAPGQSRNTINYNMMINAGAVINQRVFVNFSAINLSQMPTYTFTVGANF